MQARLLYHEAAVALSDSAPGRREEPSRVQLLKEAYEHAAKATDLAPNSLSCAALRATLAINLLVEESALLTPSLRTPGQLPGNSATTSSSSSPGGPSALELKCQELRERFRGGLAACKAALASPHPCMFEPVISMASSTHTTCDPCSMVSGLDQQQGDR